MEIGDIIVVDGTTSDYPFFTERDNKPGENAWMTCKVKVNEDEEWSGFVVSVSTTGKYRVELTEKEI